MTLPERTPRKVIVSAAIPPEWLARLDQHARALNRSRSLLIAEAVKRLTDELDAH